jgi:hypothetical protein
MALVQTETIQEVNQFLTNFATSYKVMNPVADFIAPPFQVKYESGKYVEYNKSLFRIFDDKITGSEHAKEIQWDVDEASYACEEYSMEKFVSDKKKEQAVDPIRLDRDAAKFLKQFHMLAREYRINAIGGNAAIVTQTANAGGDWDVAGGTPVADILTGMATVQAATGGYVPNRIVIPANVALQMIQTTEWKSYFQYTDSGFKNGLFNAVSGLKQLGLDIMITSVQGLSTSKLGASDPVTEGMWSDNVLLFYCEPNPSLESRTFMYSPYVKKELFFTTREPRRRGQYVTIYSDIDELLVDAQCAYLITNTI